VHKEEFISIIKEYKNLIYKICHAYCPNPADHKDLEQEIIIQLWTSMKRYNGSVKMSTWIYRIALNTAISHYRAEQKRNHIPAENFMFLQAAEYDPQTDEQIKQLYLFIEQLNYLDKALMLLYLEETKQKEIAEILGITESNVSTKINRIKQQLKLFFQKEMQ